MSLSALKKFIKDLSWGTKKILVSGLNKLVHDPGIMYICHKNQFKVGFEQGLLIRLDQKIIKHQVLDLKKTEPFCAPLLFEPVLIYNSRAFQNCQEIETELIKKLSFKVLIQHSNLNRS
jgi:hypothetical protein